LYPTREKSIRTANVDSRPEPARWPYRGAIEDFANTLHAAQAGQEWAVAILFDALQPPLLRFLRWQEPSVAEDLAAETWLAVAERIGSFDGGEGQFRAWVFVIARRRLADHRRRAARRRTAPVEREILEAVADLDDPADRVVEQLSAEEAIAHLVASLPPDQAEVLMLRVVGGLTVDESAEVMGKRPGTVRVLQHRALRRLARELGSRSIVEV
jgi:RNA polymerase sigma-70 factor (ECF subfamily)